MFLDLINELKERNKNEEISSLLDEVKSIYFDFVSSKDENNSNYNKVILDTFNSFKVNSNSNLKFELNKLLETLNKFKLIYPLKEKKNKTIIFLGASGSGKTSLFRYIKSFLKEDYASFIESLDNNLDLKTININEEVINKFNELVNGPILFIKDNKLKVRSASNLEYDLSNLSNTEKKILYYLVSILLTKEKLFYLIDDPVLNLDNEIVFKLFNYIESVRKDSIFIYLTSDVSFLKNKKETSIYLISKYEAYSKWLFTPLIDETSLPLDLLVSLTNNKPLLFCESEDESKYDYLLFSKMFKDYKVICAKGCTNVISKTKAIKKLNLNKIAYGIIDRDYLLDSQIRSYRRNNIIALPTFEIENFLCIDSFLYLVFKSVTRNYERTILKIKRNLFRYFKAKEENIILNFVVTKINANSFTIKEKENTSLEGLLKKYESFKDKIDPRVIYQDYKELFSYIESEANYFLILKYCDIKNEIINIINKEGKKISLDFNYKKLLFNLLDTKEGEEILKKVRKTYFSSL